ncbi:MAG: hypothetical protein HYS52_01050 [Candidatus Wildermuthbacteria bacterium]|nr:hypothetical protein [Candidatus Wildermuthbacteria bacterium]
MSKTFEIRKQERETNLSLVRRFTKRVKESGILKTAKKSRFNVRPLSRTKKKAVALRRLAKQKEYEKLMKLGEI